MNELSLFSGAGGGLLGTKLLGWRAVGYVENNPYCQAVLQARIQDGFLDPAPIFGDIRQFLSGGWAERYRGLVDVVSGGFPCQPFSSASRGRRTAINLWPSMLEVVYSVNPRFVFAENVHVSPIRKSATDLESIGYRCAIGEFSARSVGANHRRRRFWLVADSDRNPKPPSGKHDEAPIPPEASRTPWSDKEVECSVLGMDDGMAYRVDRLRAVGNGQVPAVVVRAWRELYGRLNP